MDPEFCLLVCGLFFVCALFSAKKGLKGWKDNLLLVCAGLFLALADSVLPHLPTVNEFVISAFTLAVLVAGNGFLWMCVVGHVLNVEKDFNLKPGRAARYAPLAAASTMVVYGLAFSVFGIRDTASSGVTHAFSTCLYYAVMTWTTVGLGDFVPADSFGRFFTGLAALNGHFAFAMLVAGVLPALWGKRGG